MENENVIPFRFIEKFANPSISGKARKRQYAASAVYGVSEATGKASIIASQSDSVISFGKSTDGTTIVH